MISKFCNFEKAILLNIHFNMYNYSSHTLNPSLQFIKTTIEFSNLICSYIKIITSHAPKSFNGKSSILKYCIKSRNIQVNLFIYMFNSIELIDIITHVFSMGITYRIIVANALCDTTNSQIYTQTNCTYRRLKLIP